MKHALRVLSREKAFASFAILTLALGIGAVTTIFSVVDSVLLKPLNYPNSEQLVSLHQIAPGAPGLADFENGLHLSAAGHQKMSAMIWRQVSSALVATPNTAHGRD